MRNEPPYTMDHVGDRTYEFVALGVEHTTRLAGHLNNTDASEVRSAAAARADIGVNCIVIPSGVPPTHTCKDLKLAQVY